MSALAKTEELLRLTNCPLGILEKNKLNPNKMRPREFDLLCENLEKTGWTDPILARPLDYDLVGKLRAKSGGDEALLIAAMIKQNVRLRIVGGHHRFDAAAFLGFESGPVTVIMDPSFGEDEENFQLVRMNTIRGKLDHNAFFTLYQTLDQKYSDDILQEAFGFADEAEFKKLITQMAKTLPDKVSQQKFKDAAAEIKTIDGLSKLLNDMFLKYGDTLPFGYMIFDYDNKQSVWLRVSPKTMKALVVIGDICIENKRTVDDIVGQVLQLIARGDSKDFVAGLVADTPEVKIPANMPTAPTLDNLQKQQELK